MLTSNIIHDMIVDYWFYKVMEIDQLPKSALTARKKACRRTDFMVVTAHKAVESLFRCPIFCDGHKRLDVLTSLGIF